MKHSIHSKTKLKTSSVNIPYESSVDGAGKSVRSGKGSISNNQILHVKAAPYTVTPMKAKVSEWRASPS